MATRWDTRGDDRVVSTGLRLRRCPAILFSSTSWSGLPQCGAVTRCAALPGAGPRPGAGPALKSGMGRPPALFTAPACGCGLPLRRWLFVWRGDARHEAETVRAPARGPILMRAIEPPPQCLALPGQMQISALPHPVRGGAFPLFERVRCASDRFVRRSTAARSLELHTSRIRLWLALDRGFNACLVGGVFDLAVR